MRSLHRVTLTALGLICAGTSQQLSGQTPPYRDARLPTADRVRDLLGRMTREEKFWQLFMTPGDLDDASNDYSHGIFGLQIAPSESARVDVARQHAERINAIQRYFVDRTRLGIPIIPFDEALHGFVRVRATAFRQAIALAASGTPRPEMRSMPASTSSSSRPGRSIGRISTRFSGGSSRIP